ncbi:MBL fold metallo-hydrolase [Novosphingobium sp. AAP83]|uniref:MBL fold metallo-hydrolase n=1 Tax=Novosphingobium sp. AAP83 TaxID=1523425 RepID=UPI000AD3EC6F|nr:MBL fold metallo-hydrolase [Novosphingobium sp. AAP83]
MSRFSKALIILLLLLGTGYYWLLVNAGPANAPIRTFDMDEIRKQADAMRGKKPTGLEYLTIATRDLPGAAMAAGTGLRTVQSGVIVWRIATPKGGIVIDSGLSQTDAEQMGFKQYDAMAAAIVGKWMNDAKMIVFTHEHIDHVGGFLDYEKFDAVAKKAIVSADLMRGMTSLWRANAGRLGPPRKMAAVEAIAPGVVLIQTPGHSAGSQMIYVGLQNGREYIFAGDTGSLASNIVKTVPRGRLLSDWLVQEDRVATIGWLKGLNLLRQQNPALVIIPSHDPQFLHNSSAQDGFTKAVAAQPAPKAQ